MAHIGTANPRKRSAITRQNLLEAAAEIFAERGYDGTTLAAIARHASVTTGAIYSNFDGKEGLLYEVLRTRLVYQNEFYRAMLLANPDVNPITIGLEVENAEPDRPRMYALILEAFAATRRNPAVRRLMSDLLAELVRRMASRVRSAQESGFIAEDIHAPTLAWLYLVPTMGAAFAEAVGMEMFPLETWLPILERFDQALRVDPRHAYQAGKDE